MDNVEMHHYVSFISKLDKEASSQRVLLNSGMLRQELKRFDVRGSRGL